MGSVYYGAYNSPGNGNWNVAANWYSLVGGSKSAPIPLGRIPNATTDTVYIYDGSVLVGPTGYSGTIGSIFNPSIPFGSTIAAGSYLGPVFLERGNGNIGGGIWSGTITTVSSTLSLTPNITGGTIYSNFICRNSATIEIRGGNFYGSFGTGLLSYQGTDLVQPLVILGGTWSPPININYHNPSGTIWPWNPGFGNSGTNSVFAPVLNITGVPDILGMGIF